MRGPVTLIENFREIMLTLRQLRDRFETPDEHAWRFVMPDDLATEAQIREGIVAFSLKIESIDVKAKFSQNRSDEDRARVIAGLEASARAEDRLLAEWMKTSL